jgi:hypothetical protein
VRPKEDWVAEAEEIEKLKQKSIAVNGRASVEVEKEPSTQQGEWKGCG